MNSESIIPNALDAYKATKQLSPLPCIWRNERNLNDERVTENRRYLREQMINAAFAKNDKYIVTALPYTVEELEELGFKVELLKRDNNLLNFVINECDALYCEFRDLLEFLGHDGRLIQAIFRTNEIDPVSGLRAYYDDLLRRREIRPGMKNVYCLDFGFPDDLKGKIHDSIQVYFALRAASAERYKVQVEQSDIPIGYEFCYRISWDINSSDSHDLTMFSAKKLKWISKFWHLITESIAQIIEHAANEGLFFANYVVQYGDDGGGGLCIYVDEFDDDSNYCLDYAPGLEVIFNDYFVGRGYTLKFTKSHKDSGSMEFNPCDFDFRKDVELGDELNVQISWESPIIHESIISIRGFDLP